MNKKSNFVLLVVIICLTMAMVYRNSPIALISIPFLFYFAVGYLSVPKNINLEISRNIEILNSFEDQENIMRISIKNNGQKIPWIEFSDQTFPGIHISSGKTSHYALLDSYGNYTVNYHFYANRGKYFWKNIVVRCSDPFRLFCDSKIFAAEGKIISYSKPYLLPKLTLRPNLTLHTPGQNLSRKGGTGLNFWGVREYHYGDSLSKIHWKLSGKYPGKYFVKEFEMEKMAEIGILIDTREIQPLFFDNKPIAEYSINAGISLCTSLISDFNRVSVFLLGNNRQRIFPGVGKYQLKKIQNYLASYNIDGNSSYKTINHIPLKFFTNQSIVFVISPLQENDHSIINRLISEGHQITLICPDPFKELILKKHPNPEESLGIRITKIERALMLQKIREMGVQVWEWDLEKQFFDLINSSKWDLRKRLR